MLLRYLFEDKVAQEKIAKAEKDITKMLKEFYED